MMVTCVPRGRRPIEGELLDWRVRRCRFDTPTVARLASLDSGFAGSPASGVKVGHGESRKTVEPSAPVQR